MDEPFWPYWGKTRSDGCYHLAAFHALDVAAVAHELLLLEPVLRAKIATLGGLVDDAVPTTVAALCALHDTGKLQAAQQVKSPIGTHLDARRIGLPRAKFDHGAGGYHELKALMPLSARIASAELLQAVCGHHGQLPSNQPPSQHLAFARTRGADRAAIGAWIGAVEALFLAQGARLPWNPEHSGSALTTLVAGLCSVADWIGSQEEHFSFQPEPECLSTYYDRARLRARQAVTAIGLAGAPSGSSSFASLFPDLEARGIQRLLPQIPLDSGPWLLIAEAEMGMGKTEFALGAVARALGSGLASHLYFALPTMATSNAMFERIEAVTPRLFSGPVNMILTHGRSRTNDAFQRLLERPLRAGEGGEEASVSCARWLLGRKRTLLAHVGVGTVDQALLSVLRVRHHFVRAFALAQSVLVVDEVHAYDAYMEVILERLVEWMGALRSPVILLSATLPDARRQRLVAAFQRGLGVAPVREPLSTGAARYPLVTLVRPDRQEKFSIEATSPARRVELEILRTDAPATAVIPRLVSAARSGAMVAWIRNTVAEAQEAYQAAQGQGVPVLLFHARFRGEDRDRIEREVLARFGASGTRQGYILIATQVAEQSLNLDFDLLFTDLAPVDLVLQRVGRVHRYLRPRPLGFEAPRVVVVAPAREKALALEFGLSAYVYDGVTLWLSLAALEPLVDSGLLLPDGIRALVERIYGEAERPAAIDAAPNAPALRRAEKKREEELTARETNAAGGCIAGASLQPCAQASFPDDEEAARAMTREGESTLLLPLLWDGTQIRTLGATAAPLDLDLESATATSTARALLDETVSVPAYPWATIEEGLPLAHETSWPEASKLLEHYLEEAGVSAIAVPMRPAAGGSHFEGLVRTRNDTRPVAYARDRGLWYPRWDELK